MNSMFSSINPDNSPLFIHGVFALFGAIVHASQAYRGGNTKNFLDFLVLTIMSSFSGVMFALLGLYLLNESSYITMAMAGTGGFLGVEGMSIVIVFIKNKFKS